MKPNTMDCDTPEALRFLASACERPTEDEWMRKAADEIERLRAERRWIPVTERLPPEETRVIAYDGEDVFESEYFCDDWEWNADVSHWMPLPPPPAE